MHFTSTLLAAIVATAISCAPTAAAEKRTVPANKTTGIGFIYHSTGIGHNCQSSGRGKFRIVNEPEHGTVRTEWRKMKGDFQGGCKGKSMNGLAIWYTPHKGYRGKDDFTVQLTVPGLYSGNTFNSGRNWSFKVNVE
jgi:hypothetical protein